MKNRQMDTTQTNQKRTKYLLMTSLFLAMLISGITTVQSSAEVSNQSNLNNNNKLKIQQSVDRLRHEALVKIEENSQAIELRKAKIVTKVSGRKLQSVVTLMLHNPNQRVLEGELVFPLADGQKITGFALDINGEMRPAVPVEKAKGQQAFEDTIRKQIDPALLEKTEGNNYKLSIYPLPEKGERTVELVIEQDLLSKNGKLSTLMPYPWLDDAQSLKHKLIVNGWQASQVSVFSDDKKIEGQGKSTLVYDLANSKQSVDIKIIPSKQLDKIRLTSEKHKGTTYVYGEVPKSVVLSAIGQKNLSSAMNYQPKIKSLSVIWDASLSGKSRNIDKEIKLLTAFLKDKQNISVDLHVLRDKTAPVERFNIVKGDTSSIERRIKSIDYDGASQLSTWKNHTANTDAVFVFTDGLQTVSDDFQSSNSPIFNSKAFQKSQLVKFVVSSTNGNNMPLLFHWARQMNGEVITLGNMSVNHLMNELSNQTMTVSITSDGLNDINVARFNVNQDDMLTFTAKLLPLSKQLPLTLDIQTANGNSIRKRISVDREAVASDSISAEIWADMTVNKLSANLEKNRQKILGIGQEFSRVTDFTSLIVLDNVQDYAKHKIVPPASLREQYDAMVVQDEKRQEENKKSHLDGLKDRQKDLIAWWKKDFPKNKKPIGISTNKIVNLPLPAMSRFEDSSMMAVVEYAKEESDSKSFEPMSATVTLKAWSSDKFYVRAVEQAYEGQPNKVQSAHSAYKTYLIQRNKYQSSPSFYLDIAEFFFSKNENELAIRILSNLAEISNDDRQLLRVLAYRLSQAGAYKQSINVLKKVTQLAPNEPQSWRDLGLAYADDKQWQNATDNLWHVASESWDGRFSDIDIIALMELNNIVANHDVDTSKYDKRLIHNLPVGMRVVLSWDTDNSDMDLWVTDPNGEKVFYGQPNSYQGGRISRDFTGGYGPEEFMLKTPKPGKYKVEAHYYGTGSQKISTQTTLQLRFFENFGSSNMKEQRTTLQLKPTDDNVFVGEFEVE